MNDDDEVEGESICCPSCVEVNEPGTHFCKGCGAPLSNLSVVCPLESTKAEGFALRRMVEGPPSKFVLVGTWLLFLPQIIAYIAYGEDNITMCVLLTAAYAILLYRVTKNYVTKSRMPRQEL